MKDDLGTFHPSSLVFSAGALLTVGGFWHKRGFRMKRGLLAVVISILLVPNTGSKSLASGQLKPELTIHFVLPNGYLGAFRLVLDKQAGVDMKRENGRYVLKIPKSGTLKIKSFKPFAELHEKTAAYQSGRKIPHDPSGSLMPKSIAFRGVWVVVGGIDPNGEMVPPVIWTYMIGTKQQVDKLKRRLENKAAPNRSLDRSGKRNDEG